MLPFGGDESRQRPRCFWNVSLESDVNINSVIEFERLFPRQPPNPPVIPGCFQK